MTTHTDLIKRLREFGPCIAQDVQDALESLEQQVAALTSELDSMRHLAAQPHAIQSVHDQLGPLSLWGAKALERHIASKVTDQVATAKADAKQADELSHKALDERDHYLRELQAIQAREAKLREALGKYRGQVDRFGEHTSVEALAIPTDDSALQERLAQERERCAEGSCVICADAIRGLA